MRDTDGANQDEFTTRIVNRLRHMNQSAKEVTEALGLPPEMTDDVLQAVYGDPTTLTTENEENVAVFDRVDGFLEKAQRSLPGLLAVFRVLREALGNTTIRQMEEAGQQRQTRTRPALGWGITGGLDPQLIGVISTVAWASLHPDSNREEISNTGASRGLTVRVSRELASYLAETELEKADPADQNLKAKIYKLVRDFVASYQSSRLNALDVTWAVLQQFPLATLGGKFGGIEAGQVVGLGLGSEESTLVQIVSLVSWAVTHTIRNEFAIAHECDRRGYPSQLTQSLANYLSSALASLDDADRP